MTSLERFTFIAQEILQQAGAEAAKLRHAEIQPEHLLIALSSHPRAMSAAILKELDVNITRLHQQLRKNLDAARKGMPGKSDLSARARRVLELAVDEAAVFGNRYIGTEHLLLGVIREASNGKSLLADYGVSLYQVHKLLRTLGFKDGDTVPAFDVAKLPLMRSGVVRAIGGLPVQPSPVFVGIVGATALAGALAYFNLPLPEVPIFIFVLGGWIISVCLHEFGHAAVAYVGGDTSVVAKGYLTLNPLKYTHRLLSIILPIIILVIGGIPLPGGAVFVDRSLMRTRRMLSLLSGAGVIAQLILITLLLIPYHFINLLGPDAVQEHANFWGAYLLVIYFNLLAIVINLLPVPGLDGYGIIEPYLSFRVASQFERIRPYGFFILVFIFLVPNPIRELIFLIVSGLAYLLGVNSSLWFLGYRLFHFW